MLLPSILIIPLSPFLSLSPSLRSAKKKEPQKDFSEVYSITAVDNPLYSIAVVDNPLYADQEEGGDIYAGGAKGYEYIVYDSGTLEMKEDLVSMQGFIQDFSSEGGNHNV